mmetsp:Transcript_10170/g.11083  ORF Transcript_10170/g.11083 Transcript_10170/m.11083 type:complete len:395 (+) Transcript_10170:61-1245(+)
MNFKVKNSLKLKLLTYGILITLCQSCPVWRCHQPQDEAFSDRDTCVMGLYANSPYAFLAQPCLSKFYGNKTRCNWDTQAIIDHGKNATANANKCVEPTSKYDGYPGQANIDNNCINHSRTDDPTICGGADEGHPCEQNNDCDVGLECSWYICRRQPVLGQSCSDGRTCATGLICNSSSTSEDGGPVCTQPFSVDFGQPADSNDVCISGYSLDGVCRNARIWRSPEKTNDCSFGDCVAYEPGVTDSDQTLKCLCSAGDKGKAYCERIESDGQFANFKKAKILATNFECHMDVPIEECGDLKRSEEDYNNYIVWSYEYINYSILQDNDRCTREVILPEYWKIKDDTAIKIDSSEPWGLGVAIALVAFAVLLFNLTCSDFVRADEEAIKAVRKIHQD